MLIMCFSSLYLSPKVEPPFHDSPALWPSASNLDRSQASFSLTLPSAEDMTFILNCLLKNPILAVQIRLSRGDLDRTLPIAEDMVRRFVLDQLLPVTRKTGSGKHDVAAGFWKARGLIEDDWTGLTRKLLATAVSDGVLTPLEDDTRGITLQVGKSIPLRRSTGLLIEALLCKTEVLYSVKRAARLVCFRAHYCV